MSAFLEGWRRILRAPAVTSGLLIGALLMNLPVAMTMRAILGPGSHAFATGYSTQGPPGWNGHWIDEIGGQLRGIEWIFAHEFLGFGSIMNVAGLFVDEMAFGPAVWMLSINAVFWMFVSGGVIDRLARDRPTRAQAFFAACGVHFFRFFRLGAILGLLFWILLSFLSGVLLWAVTQPGDPSTRQAVVTFAALLVLTVLSIAGDYAKVRIVVEDRHSSLGAFTGALRFLRRHPLRVLALYVLNTTVLVVLIALWHRVMVGPSTGEWTIVIIGAVALLLRIITRLSFMASAVAFFQSQLAHAGYAAAPLPVWPDSPSAEAIDNLVKRADSSPHVESR